MLLMFVLPMAMASYHASAQEVTITLMPGWNWISYPYPESASLETAFGAFEPMEDDMIESEFGLSFYIGIGWFGEIDELKPGRGYLYYSNRTETVTLVFNDPSSLAITTDEPTAITVTSAVVGGTVTLPEGSHVFLRGVCWGTEPNPDIDGDHTSDGTGIGSFSSTIEGLNSNTTYYVRAYMVSDHGLAYGNEVSFTTADYGYVDLGLPSGTLWATCNVGATSPEGYGDHFAWGETQPKDTYNWSTYQYCNGSSSTLTKYCNNSNYGYNCYTDNLTTLLPEDDAATANWGAGWRVPTKEEWQELRNNTTVTWTQQNGVNGRLFTASNGNSLFLPAAGYRKDSSLYDVGTHGDYWLSSLHTDYLDNAWYFYFSAGYYYMGYVGRHHGSSVRAVRSTQSGTVTYTVTATANPVAGGTITNFQEGQTCTVTVTPNDCYTFTNWTEDGEVVSTEATYSFVVTSDRTLVANFVVVDHSYVDLGLPSGTLWATCNVGANVPENYGDYFAWGETTSKDTYSWENYQYCMGSYNTLTKYCNNSNYGYNGFTDNQTTLLPEDDVVTANWGSDWRMPTEEEWQELRNNTTCTWTTQNGVNGGLFTANNGNSLFLPAAGYRYESSLVSAGSRGYYWSSSSLTDYTVYARYFRFYSGNNYVGVGSSSRSNGYSVRAVRSTQSGTITYTVTATANPVAGGTVTNSQEGQTCTVTATANEGYTFTNWTENGEVVSTEATYSFVVTSNRALVANFIDHYYVDLGLPSGTLWATCNVGAETPEEYGDYFAWGETQPKDTYNWSTYQYCMGSFSTLTKYCSDSNYGYEGFTDNLTILLPEDDAATANWGIDWRMPTKEEWQELLNNTTCTWTQQNGVNGRLFTASNGYSLFLPAAGCSIGSSLGNAGSYGYYWSSSLNTGCPYDAWHFYFYSGYYSMDYGYYRYFGQSVRAVRSTQSGTVTYTVTATASPIAGGTINNSQVGQTCTVTATPNEDYTFTNWTEDGEVVSTEAIYSFVVTNDRTLVANFIYHSYVDLGLPSGTLWATFNVGAETPEEYGDYFAWGETQPKDTYDWSNYQYYDGSNLTKYTGNDGLTILLPEDDAATANWGSDWRMPTKEEWQELYNNTTYTWTTQNGVNGYLFTASNGNNLFLPAAGCRWGDELNVAGSWGYYWSSSLDTVTPYDAWSFCFYLNGYLIFDYYRYGGYTARPVRSSRQN